MPRTCVSAAAPGLPDEPRLSRRSLLAALPAASTLSLPQAARASETHIMRLFNDWEAIRHCANSMDHPEDVHEALVDRMLEIEESMISTPAATPLDLVAKLAAFTSWGYLAFQDDDHIILDEMRSMLGVTQP